MQDLTEHELAQWDAIIAQAMAAQSPTDAAQMMARAVAEIRRRRAALGLLYSQQSPALHDANSPILNDVASAIEGTTDSKGVLRNPRLAAINAIAAMAMHMDEFSRPTRSRADGGS